MTITVAESNDTPTTTRRHSELIRATDLERAELDTSQLARRYIDELGSDLQAQWSAMRALSPAQQHHALNKLAKEHRRRMPFIAGVWRDVIVRHLGHELGPAEFRVLMGVWDRTMGWANAENGVKISDTISMAQWVYGMLTDDGHAVLAAARDTSNTDWPAAKTVPFQPDSYRSDGRGVRVFAGVGMSPATVTKALKKLVAKRLVACLSYGAPGSEQRAYHVFQPAKLTPHRG